METSPKALCLNICLFIWLHPVTDVAHSIFISGMVLTMCRTPGPLHWEVGVLATGPPGKFADKTFMRVSTYQSLNYSLVVQGGRLARAASQNILILWRTRTWVQDYSVSSKQKVQSQWLSATLEKALECGFKDCVKVLLELLSVILSVIILWPPEVKSWLIGKDPDAGKDWGQEEKRGDRGWDGWMALQTQWTWVWANSGR